METTFGGLMMPQDPGPIERYPLSIVLKDHTFEEVLTIVAPGRSIWIYAILEKKFTTVRRGQRWGKLIAHICGIISTAIRCIDCIKPIVESTTCVALKCVSGNNEIKAKLTFNQVSYLQKGNWLRICQAHPIFKVKWTLSVELETLVCCLNNSWTKICHCNIGTREDKITNPRRLRRLEASPQPDWVKSSWKRMV